MQPDWVTFLTTGDYKGDEREPQITGADGPVSYLNLIISRCTECCLSGVWDIFMYFKYYFKVIKN